MRFIGGILVIKLNKKIIFSLIFLFLAIVFSLVSYFKDNPKFTSDFKSNKGIYISNINDNIQSFILKENLKNRNEILINNIIDNQGLLNDNILNFHHYGNSNGTFKETLKGKFYKATGNKNKNLESLNYRRDLSSYILYSYYSNQFKFKYQFDRDKDYKYWGVNKDSNDLLYNNITINYYIDDKNYSVSVFDNNNNELIFVKDKDFKNYELTWNNFLDNSKSYINKKNPIVGLDEFIFPNLKISQQKLVYNLNNLNIDDKIIQKYYVEMNFTINGVGENSTNILNELNFINNKDDIKYNFIDKSILFIRDKNKQKPFFAYKY